MIPAMVAVSHIADVLGGRPVLRRRLESLAALNDAVAQGLPKTALRQTASRICPGKIEQRLLMNRIVPEATFKRRRDRLSATESERTERIARVMANAEYVWDDREDARRFRRALEFAGSACDLRRPNLRRCDAGSLGEREHWADAEAARVDRDSDWR